jgi:hypothetical protein
MLAPILPSPIIPSCIIAFFLFVLLAPVYPCLGEVGPVDSRKISGKRVNEGYSLKRLKNLRHCCE